MTSNKYPKWTKFDRKPHLLSCPVQVMILFLQLSNCISNKIFFLCKPRQDDDCHQPSCCYVAPSLSFRAYPIPRGKVVNIFITLLPILQLEWESQASSAPTTRNHTDFLLQNMTSKSCKMPLKPQTNFLLILRVKKNLSAVDRKIRPLEILHSYSVLRISVDEQLFRVEDNSKAWNKRNPGGYRGQNHGHNAVAQQIDKRANG